MLNFFLQFLYTPQPDPDVFDPASDYWTGTINPVTVVMCTCPAQADTDMATVRVRHPWYGMTITNDVTTLLLRA